MAKVAVLTYGRLRETAGHPQVQEFLDRTPHNFDVAERSDGFLGRSGLRTENGTVVWGDRTVFPLNTDMEQPVAATLSLWADLESVVAFAYAADHGEALAKRKDWFIKGDWPATVVWWVDDEQTPDWADAKQRHAHMHARGASAYAFDFKHSFGPDGQEIELDRAKIKAKIQQNAANRRETDAPAGGPILWQV